MWCEEACLPSSMETEKWSLILLRHRQPEPNMRPTGAQRVEMEVEGSRPFPVHFGMRWEELTSFTKQKSRGIDVKRTTSTTVV